jgi:5-formyltetrahydrofolate cyclo-ligase
MKKQEARTLFLSRRKMLNPVEIQQFSEQIAHQFLQEIDLTSVRTIHCFLPIATHHEVDTIVLLRQIKNKYPSIQFLIPCLENNEMKTLEYNLDMELTLGLFNVPEPAHKVYTDSTPDLVITPLIAYDQKGYRAGYGGGYYDKYFANKPANMLKIGLSFFESVDVLEDTDMFDVPLDFCVTPTTIYEFQFMNY